MTAWTSILNSAVAVGGIPSSATVTALRDNPIAMAESASGSPINVMGWHPVDKVTVGDGKEGLIYNSATDGTVASVVTPDFEDGYEYRIVIRDLSHNNGTTTTLRIEIYKDPAALYKLLFATSAGNSGDNFGVDAEILTPRLSGTSHSGRAVAHVDSAFANLVPSVDAYYVPAQKILRSRIIFAAGSIDSGKIWLFRRREYASSP